MLPKKNRLVREKDFDAVFQQGKGGKKEFLAFKSKKNNLSQSRFGFMVSKKVSLNAVERNRTKRRLRSLVLGQMNRLKTPADVVIIAMPGASRKSFEDFRRAVSGIFDSLL